MSYSIIILFALGIMALVRGVPAALHPTRVAARNADLIGSGEDEFFEQHRSWKAYGNSPSTDAAVIERNGRFWVAAGVIALVVAILSLVMGR